MSSIIWKNFNLCLSKLKCFPTTLPSSPPSKHDHNRHPSSSSSSSISSTSSILIKNFNSLYDLTSDSTSKSLTRTTDDFLSTSEDSVDSESPPDFATVFASQRFFFSSPGRSNSIFEASESPPESDAIVNGGVAVHTYSPNPYEDFRRSMQEMAEARELRDVAADWDYLHELLLCYLTLNPKHTHKFIIRAFADLIVCLMSSTASDGRRGSAGPQRHGASQWFA
ncbi:Transcription repressor OFP12 [Vitis vinifera]|uniref:Transcription repressor n=1 Tax=Vitis vinifera TaxID=29760 RepID=A0A438KM09_VITVI|nr:Transcription repressor OFP12 [Vitis vinifera]